MKKMKFLGLIAVLTSLFQCASVSFEENPPFKIIQASYKNYVGGIPGVSGIKVKIYYDAKKNIAFDSVFFQNKKAKVLLETINKVNLLSGHFSTSTINSKEDLILHKNQKKEYGNKPPEKKPRFDLKDNQAIISYIENGKTKFFKVENLKKEPTDYLPATKPK